MKPLVIADIRARAASFVANWKDEPGDEKQQAQTFVRDLLQVFGISEKAAALYEKRARRASTGLHGYIDALITGTALFEMKSAGKDLVAAEQQALDYIESLSENEKPHTVICSDFKRFRILDLMAADGLDVLEFPLEDLPNHVEDLLFLAGYKRKASTVTEEQASVKAAQLMAKLYEHLERTGYYEHQASVFLIRTLFCLYADDSGLWERDLFTRYLEERTAEDGSDLGSQLSFLFQALNQPEDKRYTGDELIAAFPYVNGAVFGEAVDIPSFDRAARETVLEAAHFNWSSISPAIFGSLFQAVKSKEARRELGEHYTTETNILKALRPLFLDELEQEFIRAFNSVGRLEGLLRQMGELHIFDPACGCGNFLIIAYRELRALELRILERLFQLDKKRSALVLVDAESLVSVRLGHFHGIEIEDWPATIARTAMFLVEHQANQAASRALGMTRTMLPLGEVADIQVGNALRVDWAKAVLPPSNKVYVVGNPPFIGQYTKKADQTDDMKHVWGSSYDGYLDYVTAWFKRAMDYFGDVSGRFAFVSTNSIAQGQPVPALFGPLFNAGWRIRFAHLTFAWTSEAPGAAAVHCIITGFDKQPKGANGQYATPTRVFSYAHVKADPVEHETHNLNAYLVEGPNVLITKRSKPLSTSLPPVIYGSKPADGSRPSDPGHLIINTRDAYEQAMADPHAAKYVRRYVGARELIHNLDRWCLWMEDADPADVKASPFLTDRLTKTREFREASEKTGDAYKLRTTPHLFRPNKSRPKGNYVCIPRHFSMSRSFATVAHFDETTVSGDANFIADDPDGFLFALISSSMFMTWQRAVGGRIKSDYRFSNTIVWNNFPLPEVNAATKQRIIDAGRAVLEARNLHPNRSLDAHYAPLSMDPALVKAHQTLDREVDKAFGARNLLETDEQRLRILFTRYQDLIDGQTLMGRRRARR